MAITNEWKADLQKFVGKSFDIAYANRLNSLLPIIGEDKTSGLDYELASTEGYGEMDPYDGQNLNQGKPKRGFKTVIVTGEFNKTASIGRKEARIDKFGSTRRVGKKLGQSASLTVYAHALRLFARAFDPNYAGGDGLPWASEVHPVASKYSEGRKYIADPESGIYSNLAHTMLSVSAITDLQTKANRFVTPDGSPFLCDMNTLIVSPELVPEAKKICGDNGRLRPTRNPEDDTNAANPLPDLTYIVMGGGKDGFTKKQWAVCDRDLMQDMVKIIYGERPTVIENDLDNPLLSQYVAYADFGLGFGDGRQIIFSDPA